MTFFNGGVMSMVGNILTAKDVVALSACTQITAEQKLDDIVDMGQISSFQGNAMVEALASILASKEINPETLQNLPGTLQRRIEEVRKQIIPSVDHGSIQIYYGRQDSIHTAALLRHLIDGLFLAWPRDLLTQFESDESDPDQVVKYLGANREVTLLDEPSANALVVARFLRENPDCFESFVTFSNVSGYQWRRWTWEKLGRFGLPFQP